LQLSYNKSIEATRQVIAAIESAFAIRWLMSICDGKMARRRPAK
jgi:hypothetical protein